MKHKIKKGKSYANLFSSIPRKDQSAAKAVSYKQQRGSQTACQLIDNRPEAVSQRKLQTIANKHSANEVFQLRATKYITAHARSHYHDGWGQPTVLVMTLPYALRCLMLLQGGVVLI